MKAKILIADDDRNLSEVLRGILRRLEHRVKICDDIMELARLLSEEEWNLLICDARMWRRTQEVAPMSQASRSGEPNLVSDAQDMIALAQSRAIPVIVTVTYGSQPLAEEALKSGAFICVVKPFRADEVLRAVEQGLALNKENKQKAGVSVPSPLPEQSSELHLGYFIGESPLMAELYGQIQ